MQPFAFRTLTKMVLKLYGHPFSTSTKHVAITLHEKKVPFEFIIIDLPRGEHKTPAVCTHQPFAQVPYIDDDGFILFESRAIARYIALKYPDQGTPGLVPPQSDLKKTALFERAASMELTQFDPHASKVAVQRILNPWVDLISLCCWSHVHCHF